MTFVLARFRKRCTKEDFDAEARKLLPAESSHLHNEFLLAILNKCQTLVGFTTLPTPTVSSVSPTKASSPGSGMSPNTGLCFKELG
jgi:transcriptional adapter 1